MDIVFFSNAFNVKIIIDVCVPLNYLTSAINGATEMLHNHNTNNNTNNTNNNNGDHC